MPSTTNLKSLAEKRSLRLANRAAQIRYILNLAKDAPPQVVERYWGDIVPAIEIWFDQGASLSQMIRHILECVQVLESEC